MPENTDQDGPILGNERPRRERKTPSRLEDYVIEVNCTRVCTPDTYEEAVHSGDSDKWINSMDGEMKNMEKYNTWELVQLPDRARIIPIKWRCTMKSDGKYKS